MNKEFTFTLDDLEKTCKFLGIKFTYDNPLILMTSSKEIAKEAQKHPSIVVLKPNRKKWPVL